ncbi:MAG TPA: ABC transporter ATP-binding protein [Gemmatimonadaceae bacterium]|nr:ABC transporter ATP-binding protein [Gemmatimonadaceae bacterium]
MITLQDVAKRFGRVEVLRGVDLALRPGRVTAIVGPNGAGKTTMIKIILGLARADRGRVLFDGRPVTDDPAYRARIGYMPQIARFPEHLTGVDLLAMLEDLRGGAAAVDRGLVERFRLEDQLAKPLRVLSGGTRQKVNAAMAFLFRPDLLVLDEPTAGLDPVASSVLKDEILGARAGGRTFLITSHIMSELEELADDVAFLLDGQVRFAGPLDDLKRDTRQVNLERAIARLMTRGVAA